MNALYRFDEYLISQCERFSHWTQCLIGLRACHIERVLLTVSVLLYSTYFFNQPLTTWTDKLMYLWYVLALFSSYRREDRRCHETMNSEKIGFDRFLRVCLLPIGAVNFILPIEAALTGRWLIYWRSGSFWFCCFYVSCYFAACDDLPYSPSRLKLFLRSLSFGRLRMPQPMES